MGFGHVLAVLAGFSSAFVAICSRKSARCSVWMLTLSPAASSVLIFGLLPLTPVVDDFSMQRMLDSPLPALGWTIVLFLCSLLTSAMGSAGYKWCPAALSTMVSTAARMVWGYLAQ